MAKVPTQEPIDIIPGKTTVDAGDVKIIGPPKREQFIVRVPLVCPHCSSYMHVLPSGTVMTCHTERCPNHLRKFRLPRLIAEEVLE